MSETVRISYISHLEDNQREKYMLKIQDKLLVFLRLEKSIATHAKSNYWLSVRCHRTKWMTKKTENVFEIYR